MRIPFERGPFLICLAQSPATISNNLFTSSTAYFPPLAWFTQALRSGKWAWEGHENYQKGGWRNRCRIATANGPLLLSVPLEGGKHRQMPVQAVKISYRTDWQRQHEQTIRSAYGRAPYFEFYADPLFAAARSGNNTLWDYNWLLTTTIISLLQLPLDLSVTENFGGGSAGSETIAEANPPYRQVFEERHGFIEGLSILDALFCMGPEFMTLSLRE